MTTPTEVGRELKVADLKPEAIVVIAPPGRDDLLITMWVAEVRDNLVVFRSGELNWHVINLVLGDGTIVDDQGRPVRVFEYLGAP